MYDKLMFTIQQPVATLYEVSQQDSAPSAFALPLQGDKGSSQAVVWQETP